MNRDKFNSSFIEKAGEIKFIGEQNQPTAPTAPADSVEGQQGLNEPSTDEWKADEEGLTDEQKKWWKRMQEFEITADMELKGRKYLLIQDDLKFLPTDELHILAAHKKMGKSTSATIIASMVLGSGFGGVKAGLENARVLLVGTEEGDDDVIIKSRYVDMLCGRKVGQKTFKAFDIRGEGPVAKRNEFDASVRALKPTLAIVDVVSDLLVDMSDKAQVSEVMTMFEALRRDVGCAILAVIHYNKTSEFIREAFGTELGNKCYDLLTALKEKRGDDDFLFKIEGDADSRGLPMKAVRYLRKKEDGLPIEFNGFTEEEMQKIQNNLNISNSVYEYISEHPKCCDKDIRKFLHSKYADADDVKTSNGLLKTYIETACKTFKDIHCGKGKNNRNEYEIKG